MFGHGFDKLVSALLCGRDTKFKLPNAGNGNVRRNIFFYTWVHPDTNVCGGFAVVRPLSVDEHKHSPAKIR